MTVGCLDVFCLQDEITGNFDFFNIHNEFNCSEGVRWEERQVFLDDHKAAGWFSSY